MTEVIPTQVPLPMDGLPPDVQQQVGLVERGRWTDARILESAARLRGAGIPVRMVCECLHVSPHLVQVAETERPDLVVSGKERRAALCDLTATALVESLLDDTLRGKVKPEAKSLSAGILMTKSAELRGESTVTVEVVDRRLGDEQLTAALARIRERMGSCIDVESTAPTRIAPQSEVNPRPEPRSDPREQGEP